VNELSAPTAGPVSGRQSRFEWRGVMIDSARTRHGVPAIKRVIELMARYGFNRLHWHLTDDQGWRFEVSEYPRLISESAYLPRDRFAEYHSLLGDTRERALREQDERWTNGFYTDAEIAEINAHASAHGILIVPEVDLPGHMAAAIQAYPELGRPAGLPLPEGSMREHMWWPARNDLLWPTDAARDFVAAVMRRIATLFPGPLVHIGGDECAYQQWASDPEITTWMTQHGVARVEDMQGWFMTEAARTLAEHGKKVAVWDEACDIWDDEDALVVAWAEQAGMDRIARSPQRFVFADARTLYLNRIDPDPNSDDTASPQKGMLPGISVHDILTASWPLTESERCIGIQACAWSEFILDGDDLLQMLFPRLIAVAERLWSTQIDPADAAARIAHEHAVLTAAGALRVPAENATPYTASP